MAFGEFVTDMWSGVPDKKLKKRRNFEKECVV